MRNLKKLAQNKMPKLTKDLPALLLIVAFIAFTIIIILSRTIWRKGDLEKTTADSVATSVTVGNTGPTFTSIPAENPVSTTADPTNSKYDVTFQATATEPNSENYYLAICKSDAITPVSGSAPTCDGGAWCVSTATASGNQATCSYTTANGDTETNAWYGFVCDGNSTNPQCSTSSQGSGDGGSPFQVNHQSSFTNISDDGPKDPGGTITFTSTASDPDSAGGNDTIMLVVCKTAGVSGTDCDGGATDRYCRSDSDGLPPFPHTSDPSCTFDIPNPEQDQSYNYYTYIFDNHEYKASSSYNDSFTVNNIAPVVSNVSLNSGSDISLINPQSTTDVTFTATVTDNNGCNDLSSVTGYLYRSGVGYTGCDTASEANNNHCYYNISCSVGTGNQCSGDTDSNAGYECTESIQYHADPTDANTEYPTENWLSTIKADDDQATPDETEVGTGVELLSYVAHSIESPISYGSLEVGEISDSTVLPQTTLVTAVGNVGLDEDLSGTDMTDGGINVVLVTQQKYAATALIYSSATSLTGSAAELELNCLKTTTTASPATKNIYWGLQVPSGTAAVNYTGTNTATAAKSESAEW